METQKMDSRKVGILEQMAKEIGSDAWNLTKKVTKATAKGALYLATAPVIGALNQNTRERIYNYNDKLATSAQYLSMFTPVLSYLALTDVLTQTNPDFMTGAFALGVGEAAVRHFFSPMCSKDRNDPTLPGSVVGYIPSKMVDYLFSKYDSAKEKIEGGQTNDK